MLQVFLVITPNVLLLDYAGPAEAFAHGTRHGRTAQAGLAARWQKVRPRWARGWPDWHRCPPACPNSLVLVTGNANESEDYAGDAAQQVVRWLRTLAGLAPEWRASARCAVARAGRASRRSPLHAPQPHGRSRASPRRRRCWTIPDIRGRRSVLTSAGITTGIDLALHLVQQLTGRDGGSRGPTARHVPAAWPDDVQLSPWLAHRNHLHPAVHRARDLIAGTLATDPAHRWTLAQLADAACVKSAPPDTPVHATPASACWTTISSCGLPRAGTTTTTAAPDTGTTGLQSAASPRLETGGGYGSSSTPSGTGTAASGSGRHRPGH